MRKRKYIIRLIIAMISVGILFTGTKVMAVDLCGPDFNEGWLVTVLKNGSLSVNKNSGVFMKFLGIYPHVCSDTAPCGTNVPNGTYYKWAYQIQDANGTWQNLTVSNIEFFLPAKNDGCDLNNEYFITGGQVPQVPGSTNLYAPGNYLEVGGNPYWRFVFERVILNQTSDDSSSPPQGVVGKYYSFYTKLPSRAKVMSAFIKSGSNTYIFQTLGPSPPVVPSLLGLYSTCENILSGFDPDTGEPTVLANPFSMKTTINQENCEIAVSVYEGLNCQTNETILTPINVTFNLGDTNYDLVVGGSTNQQCPLFTFIGHNNPCSKTVSGAGGSYTICFNCLTGQRVDCP